MVCAHSELGIRSLAEFGSWTAVQKDQQIPLSSRAGRSHLRSVAFRGAGRNCALEQHSRGVGVERVSAHLVRIPLARSRQRDGEPTRVQGGTLIPGDKTLFDWCQVAPTKARGPLPPTRRNTAPPLNVRPLRLKPRP